MSNENNENNENNEKIGGLAPIKEIYEDFVATWRGQIAADAKYSFAIYTKAHFTEVNFNIYTTSPGFGKIFRVVKLDDPGIQIKVFPTSPLNFHTRTQVYQNCGYEMKSAEDMENRCMLSLYYTSSMKIALKDNEFLILRLENLSKYSDTVVKMGFREF